jgi:DNA modification methylase
MIDIEKVTVGNCELYLGGSFDILPQLGTVDAVVTDPPYNLSTSSSGTKHEIWADAVNTSFWFSELLKKEKKLLNLSGGTIWQFLNWKTLPALQKAASDADLIISSILVWDKALLGTGNRGLRSGYELCALILTGKAKIKNSSLPDIWRFPWTSVKPNHPAEKPVALLKKIILETEGETILDPFMGSGTAGVACVETGRRFTGIEINSKYFDTACQRIREAARIRELNL